MKGNNYICIKVLSTMHNCDIKFIENKVSTRSDCSGTVSEKNRTKTKSPKTSLCSSHYSGPKYVYYSGSKLWFLVARYLQIISYFV